MADALEKTLRGLRALGRDRQSGAGEIADRAVALLEDYSRRARRDGHAPQAPVRLAQATLKAHPSMAPLLNLANQVELAAEEGHSVEGLQRRLAAFRRAREQAPRRIARRFAKRLRRGSRVLTYSYSSTVLAALVAARNRLREVVVSEGRPGHEGRRVAERLARRGIRVTLVVDAALAGEMPGAQAVVVGADAVRADSYVNKVGTAALQEQARRLRKPFFVLADTTKFLPPALAPWHELEDQPRSAVWQAPPRGVEVRNQVFEVIPLAARVTLINEHGALTPRRLNRMVKSRPVARRWKSFPRRKP